MEQPMSVIKIKPSSVYFDVVDEWADSSLAAEDTFFSTFFWMVWRGKSDTGVTKKILLLVMWEMRCSVCRVGAIGDGGKMTSQLTNVIQELFGHSAGRSSASSRSDIAATGGHITSPVMPWIRCFRRQTDWQSVSLQSKTFNRPAYGVNKDH